MFKNQTQQGEHVNEIQKEYADILKKESEELNSAYEKMMQSPPDVEFTIEEQAFRRGFAHGVYAGFYKKCTPKEANEWRNSEKTTCPPGTAPCIIDRSLPGLTN